MSQDDIERPAPDYVKLLKAGLTSEQNHIAAYREACCAQYLYTRAVGERRALMTKTAKLLSEDHRDTPDAPRIKQENDEIDQLLENLDRWDKLADQAYSVITSAIRKDQEVFFQGRRLASEPEVSWLSIQISRANVNLLFKRVAGLSALGAAWTYAMMFSASRGDVNVMSWAFSLYCSGSVVGMAAAVALAADSHGRVRPWSGGDLAWVALAIAAIADVAASILLIVSVVNLTGSVTLSSRTVRRSTILIIPCAAILLWTMIVFMVTGWANGRARVAKRMRGT